MCPPHFLSHLIKTFIRTANSPHSTNNDLTSKNKTFLIYIWHYQIDNLSLNYKIVLDKSSKILYHNNSEIVRLSQRIQFHNERC